MMNKRFQQFSKIQRDKQKEKRESESRRAGR